MEVSEELLKSSVEIVLPHKVAGSLEVHVRILV